MFPYVKRDSESDIVSESVGRSYEYRKTVSSGKKTASSESCSLPYSDIEEHFKYDINSQPTLSTPEYDDDDYEDDDNEMCQEQEEDEEEKTSSSWDSSLEVERNPHTLIMMEPPEPPQGSNTKKSLKSPKGPLPHPNRGHNRIENDFYEYVIEAPYIKDNYTLMTINLFKRIILAYRRVQVVAYRAGFEIYEPHFPGWQKYQDSTWFYPNEDPFNHTGTYVFVRERLDSLVHDEKP